jgi:hypothetical protein
MNAATRIPRSDPETDRLERPTAPPAGLRFPEVLDDPAARRPDAEAAVAPEGRVTRSRRPAERELPAGM